MSYPDFSEKYPQVPQATGAVVLTADELSAADFAIIINAGAVSAVTTLGNLGTFFGNGTIIPLGGDVVGSTGTNTVQAIGGHSVDLGGTLSTGGAVAFEGAFSWVGNLTGATDVTFPAGTNTLGTMSSFTAITTAGTQTVEQGSTLTVIGGTMSDWIAGTGFANSGSVTNGQTANIAVLSGDVVSVNSDGTIATTVTAVGGHGLTLQGSAMLPAGTMLPNTLASADIFVGNSGGVAVARALSGDVEISNTGGVTVLSAGGVDFGSLAFLNAVPAGTLTGTTLAPSVVNSSLTGVGTIASGTWQGTTLAYPYLPASVGVATVPFGFVGLLVSGQNYVQPVTQAGTLLANGGTGFTYTKGVNPAAAQTLVVGTVNEAGAFTALGTISINPGGTVTAPTYANTAYSGSGGIALQNQATADVDFASWSFGIQFQKT